MRRHVMRFLQAAMCLAVVLVAASLCGEPARSASPVTLQRDGTIGIAGRSLRCGGIRAVLDRRLPNLGVAMPGILVMNPGLLDRQSTTVQFFVFHHECGHHHVGGSELKADCWAVTQGVRDGWLDRTGLSQVCRSFGDAPPTPTHPSGKRRCANLEQCFAAASTAIAQGKPEATPAAGRAAVNATPRLTAGPTLVRTGKVPSFR
jgi:hypothetical protein